MEAPDNLKPKQTESRENFMARCMTNSRMTSAFDEDQRADMCAVIFEEAMPPAPAPNEEISEIDLFGIVGLDFDAAMVSGFLREAGGPVRINLFSGGGSLFEGAAIFALLSRYDKQVTVDILGLAASAASYLAMAGDVVRMDAGGQFMIHNAIGEVRGNPAQLRDTADEIERQQMGMITAYVKKTGKAQRVIMQMMDDETWMGAEAALEMGFIDAIFEMEETRDIAASIDPATAKQLGYKNLPKELNSTAAKAAPSTRKNDNKKQNDMADLKKLAAQLVDHNPSFNGGSAEGATPEAVAAEISTLTATVDRLSSEANDLRAERDELSVKVSELKSSLDSAQTVARAARVDMELKNLVASEGVELSADAEKAARRRVSRYIALDPDGDEADLREDMRDDAIRYVRAEGVETGEDKTLPRKPKGNQRKVDNTPSMQPETGTEAVVNYEMRLQAKISEILQKDPGLTFSGAKDQAKAELQAAAE